MNEHTPSTNRNPVRLLAITLAAAGLLVSACGTGGEADGAVPAVADLPAETDGADIDAGGDSDRDGGSANGENRPEPTEEDIEAAELEFEQCLADAGVDASGLFGGDGEEIEGDGGGATMAGQISADGLDDDEFNAAMEKCNKIFEDTFGTFEPSPEDQARLADAEAAFANCMAEAGFDIPESDGSGGIMVEFLETTEMDVFDEASERCSAEAFDDDLFVGDDTDGSE